MKATSPAGLPAVTLTRHYSGFTNIADTYSIGDHERDGKASTRVYELPPGYTHDDEANVIRDPRGFQCAIVPHSCGRPQVVSLAGPVKTSPVLIIIPDSRVTIVALLSPQGTACAETALIGADDTPANRSDIERALCTGGPDSPVAGTWTDCSDNEALWPKADSRDI